MGRGILSSTSSIRPGRLRGVKIPAKIVDRIIGLGYVGLPLALQFAKSGVEVLGLDIDVAKIDFISQKRSYIKTHDGVDYDLLL